MKYRMFTVDENTIMIDDVIEIEERLVMGHGVAYGLKVGENIEREMFFKKLRKAILKRLIYKLARRGNKLFIGWIEVKAGHPIFHDDEFDLSECDQKFYDELDVIITKFRCDEDLIKERVAKKILKRCVSNDLFVRSSKYMKESSKHRNLDRTLEVREAEELFKYMLETTKVNDVDLLEYVPMKSMFESTLSGLFYKGFDKLVGVIALPLIATMAFTGSLWLGVIMGVSYVAFVLWFSDLYLKKEEENKRSYLPKLIRKMESAYGFSQQKVIDRELARIHGKSFVEAIYEDLDFIEENPSYGCDTEQLKILAWEYSSLKEFEVFYGREQVDKADFLVRLAECEIAMYSKNPSFGFVQNKENISVGVRTLEERLGMLGWTKEKIRDDLFVSSIYETIEEVLKCPYEGCEVELTKLIQLAVRYVDGRNKVFFKENGLADFHSTLKEIENTIADKIFECKRLDEMVEREDELELVENPGSQGINFKTQYNLGI